MKFHIHNDLQECITHALRQERMDAARAMALPEIEERLDTGAVPGFVEQFLLAQWLQVLCQAHANQDPQAVKSALQQMDDLIWSITPKTTQQQRQELLTRLPAIVNALNQTLDLIDWHDSARQAFFSKLAERQAVYARSPLSSRRKVEYAVTVAQKASERKMAKQQRRPRGPDEASRTVDAIRQGQWMEFQFQEYTNEPMLRYKLAWISPAHTTFIFVKHSGEDFFAINHADLCQALRERQACCVFLHEM